VSKIAVAMMGVTLLVIVRQSRIDMSHGIGQCTSCPTNRPRGVVGLKQHFRIIQLTPDSKKIVRNLFRSAEAAIAEVEYPKVRNGRSKLLRTFEPVPNVSGALNDFANFGCRHAMNVHQGRAKL
jgi:hypothetical protein